MHVSRDGVKEKAFTCFIPGSARLDMGVLVLV
jgi:hypothetical protein